MQLIQNALVLNAFHAKGQMSCVSNKYSLSQKNYYFDSFFKGDTEQAYL